LRYSVGERAVIRTSLRPTPDGLEAVGSFTAADGAPEKPSTTIAMTLK